MKSHELMRELLQHANAKQTAASLGLSTSMIYKWTEPSEDGGSGTVNPLDRVEQLAKLTDAERIAQWVCHRAGGYFVKNTRAKIEHREHSLTKATHGIVQEFADMLSAVATAALDNNITQAEARDIRARWQQLKSEMEEFVCSCEEGEFRKILERHPHPHADKHSAKL
jgi:hypothetical protein